MLTPNDTISERDAMFRAVPNKESYLRAGKTVADTLSMGVALSELKPQSILDYGCGHGRILRWLQAYWPQAKLTAADVQPDQIAFCARTFGATPFQISKPFPEIAFDTKFDLIWLGSIFTHMDQSSWHELIDNLLKHLNKNGVLTFSFAGRRVHSILAAGDRFGFKPDEEPAVLEMITRYEQSGFGFLRQLDSNGRPWGRSLASPTWVLDTCMKKGTKVVMFSEAAYAKRQDIICLMRD